MIEIDGSFGEGGGQILRTSLTLAALTGQAVHLDGIRARRRKPGLMRQHLTCVKAVAEVAGGTLTGAELNSQELTFIPGKIRAGNYHFAVGSAGNSILIAQTVIPVLLCADASSTIVIEGGTHTENAPVYEFFEQVYLPCLRQMGAKVEARMEQIGFYPAGGGKIVLEITPVSHWNPFCCMKTGTFRRAELTALGCDLDEKILNDELFFCRSNLQQKMNWRTNACSVESAGPGNVLYAKLEYRHITELFSVCGKIGRSRKTVGELVAGMVDNYLAAGVPVGEFLADQLLLPMAAGAGGEFLTLPPSLHTLTNSEVILHFLNVQINIENLKNGTYTIEVKK